MCSASMISIITCFKTSISFMVNKKLIGLFAVCCFAVFLTCGKYLAKATMMQELEKMHGRKWSASHISFSKCETLLVVVVE